MSGTYVLWPPPPSAGSATVSSGSLTLSIGSMDSNGASAFGATNTGGSLFMQSASATAPGLVNIAGQTFAGTKTFASTPIIATLAAAAPLLTTGAGLLTSGSVSLTNQVSGILPLSQTSGSLSLTNQVSGNLPLSQTTGSLSLVNQVSGNLPVSQTSGSISLTNQVFGNLPLSQTSGSISLTNQVFGVLPLANMTFTPLQPGVGTTGSISLTQQVSGILPLANTSTIPIQSGGQSSGSISLTTQVVGVLPTANMSAVPAVTGSVTITSSVSGSQYTVFMPGTQGNPAGTQLSMVNDGAGHLSWGFSAGGTISASTTYVVGSTDAFIMCTGSSFSLVLPSAVGAIRKQPLVINHGGTSLVQLYTLNTVGSQTIGGVSGNNTWSLATNLESVSLIPDGANWQIQNHYASTGWINAGATTIRGTTTDPSKGSATLTVDKTYWRRIGSNIEVRVEYVQTAQGTATSGSGDYLFIAPANVIFDVTNLTVYTTVVGNGAAIKASNSVGGSTMSDGVVAASTFGGVYVMGSTSVRIGGADVPSTAGTSNSLIVSSARGNIGQAAVNFAFSYSVPVFGWQP